MNQICSPNKGLYCCCCYCYCYCYYYYIIILLLFCNLISTTEQQHCFFYSGCGNQVTCEFQFSSRGARVNGSECHVHVLLMSGTCSIFHLLVEVHYLEVLKKCHAAILPYL